VQIYSNVSNSALLKELMFLYNKQSIKHKINTPYFFLFRKSYFICTCKYVNLFINKKKYKFFNIKYMILLTGSSGFFGQQILTALDNNNIKTLSQKQSDFVVNLASTIPEFDFQFATVIHCAGQAHMVPKTVEQKQKFYDVNITGTKNLLIGLERMASLPKAFVFISSVSVYGLENGNLINETAPLLATDPYGNSKIQAESLIQNWCLKNNVTCTILRLPLLAGPNPPGNLASMIKGIKAGYYFNIAGGKAKKSMVLAKDVAKIIPVVANIGGTYNLTDKYHPDFSELSTIIAEQLGKSKPLNIPEWLAIIIAKVGDLVGTKAPLNSRKLNKIVLNLTFDDSKAVTAFGWNPTPVLQGFSIE